MAQPKPPTNEAGHGGVSLVPWTGLSDPTIDVPDLVWPQSITTYDHMRRDSQVAALLSAIVTPLRRYRWMIDPNGARDEVTALVASDFNLPILGTDPGPLQRQRDRFSHDNHLYHAFLAIAFGHMYFEQEAVYRDKDQRFHLKALHPRMPATIAKINVNRSGGLDGIEQYSDGTTGANRMVAMLGSNIPIPVNRLTAYIHAREGGNWFGRSLLINAYKNWLLKDRLLRVDALKHERNGMGIPEYEAPPGASDAVMQDLAEKAARIRVGTYSGGASPAGARLRLVGVEGHLPDTLASIRYQDEQMARLMLAMFMQLGTTATGSRALGAEFVDFFSLAQQTYATWYADVTNQHVIEDLVDWNWGEDEQAPLLMYVPNDDAALEVPELVSLVHEGVLTLDPELEGYVRQRYTLPDMTAAEKSRPPRTVTLPPPAPAQLPVAAGRRTGGRIRASRRQPTPEESASGADFAGLLTTVQQGQADLVTAWQDVRTQAIAALLPELTAAIAAGELSTLDLDLGGALVEAMAPIVVEIANAGLAAVVTEAAAQGVVLSDTLVTEATLAILNEHLGVVEGLLERGLVLSATREAVRRAGVDSAPEQVSTAVESYLQGLADTWAEEVLGGTAASAMNAGRADGLRAAPTARYYASEINDSNTCKKCKAIDGTKFDTLADCLEHYPTGGYVDCLGRDRCRGTFVGVYQADEPAVETPVAQKPQPVAQPVAAGRG